ncbi:SAV_2336 N-terminal domain-related protein [Streptomyces smyrnaeus]|uniref:SAV_2336 N-terminal domain-related protein n=1 Tax=Streptomyces smyrnaeus TaxID=1387713 RepID=UPI0033B6AC4F
MSAASTPPRQPSDHPRSAAAPWAERQSVHDVAELVARLRAAGRDPSSEELAEALWLARFGLGRTAGEPDVDSTGLRYSGTRTPQPEPPMPPAEDHDATEPAETPPATERTAPVSLFAPRRHGGAPPAGFPVRAPAAGALSGLLELQHALRPLHGYRPPLPPATGALDEAATADLSARSTAVRPVFGTEVRRYSEIQLIMDASPTASVWQPTLERLRQTFEQLGAFRDVQVRYLHRARDGAPLIGTGPVDGTARLRPADEYRDTTGRRLTLVVSDCVGALWQDGRAQRLLHHWSGRSPLAVVQPLPPRLWPRTALPAEAGLLLRGRGSGGRVTFEPDSYGPPPPAGAVPVPVLLPTPEALGNWARLLGTDSERAVAGAAAWVLPRHPAMPAPRTPAGAVPARTLLREFRNTASPGALDLAVHLAVVPLLLPVIHLVQEAMLPDTGPMELAEVLLSGLLTRLPEEDEPDGTDRRGSLPGPRYAFAPGVRELLLQSLDQGAAVLILKHLSGYVAQRFGKGTRNFAAMAVAQLTGRSGSERAGREPAGTVGDGAEPDEAEDGDEMFATIPAEVVRFYLPEQTAADQVAETERLLRRWRSQGDIQLLHRARSVGEAARAADRDSARARLALGRVLHALAGTAAVRRSPQGPEPLLRDAAELLTDNEPGTLLERAGVEHSLWQVRGGSRHLLRAEGLLRSLAGRTGSATAQAAEPAAGDTAAGDTAERALLPDAERTRKLRLGRVLLALAQTAPEHRHRAAPEAVSELREASDMLADRAPGFPEPSGAPATSETRPAQVAPQAPDSRASDSRASDEARAQRCGALLDLASALRLSGAPPQERLDVLAQAGALAGERSGLRLRCARERARVLRETRDWEAAAEAYTEAERLSGRDSTQRGELLIEWGEMLLTEAGDLSRAEGLLREALTRAPSGSPTVARAALLLGRVLLLRYERESFLPDLYEGCHLLEQAARQGPDAESRAQAWLRLGRARTLFPAAAPESQQVAADLTRALDELADAREGGSVTAARALHGRAEFHRSQGRTEEALADYRAAEAEWQLLAGQLADLPWAEVRDTRDRVAELAG